MEILYRQVNTKVNNPDERGWYNTDKGKLFWFPSEKNWSCRAEFISEEYPNFWYEQFTNERELAGIGVLIGESAEKFQEAVDNPKVISQEELNSMKENDKLFMEMALKPIKEDFYKEFNERQYVNKSLCDKIFEWFSPHIR